MSVSSGRVAVIGGGPAGLMAAEAAANAGARVAVFDRMPSLGRKFLMAGRGGLNLTHSEPLEPFLARYGAAGEKLAPLIRAFPPEDLRAWARGLGVETFVGTSGRVFPLGLKASPLLRAWLRRLGSLGVEAKSGHEFRGWDAKGALLFRAGGHDVRFDADATIRTEPPRPSGYFSTPIPRNKPSPGPSGVSTRASLPLEPSCIMSRVRVRRVEWS